MAGRQIISDLIYRLTADDKDLTKKLKESQKRAEDLSKKFTQVGKSLTLGLTVPIAAAGTAAVKLASDTAESLNAVNVVFGDSADIITDWGENAAELAGLTSAEFNQASAVIGAGLLDAGIAADEAANSTNTLVSRASDLASIFNTDVDEALTAIGAGLRGESEPLRRFAVTLSEAAVNAEAVALGLADSESEVSQYAKTQARLSLILEKTNRFQGDFQATSDDLANSTRILRAQIKEAAGELGEVLLPVVLEGVTFLRDLVTQFRGLDEQQRETIVRVAALAAAIGPLLLVIGKTITSVNAISGALKALSVAGGGPVALAIAGVTALAAGIALIVKRQKELNEQRIEETYAEIGASAKLATGDLQALEQAINVFQFAANDQEVLENARQLAVAYGVTTDEVLELAEASENFSDLTKEQVANARELAQAEEQAAEVSRSLEEDRQRFAEERKQAQQDEIKRIEEEQAARAAALEQEEARREAVGEARLEALTKTRDEIEILDVKLRQSLITQEEYIDNVNQAYEDEIDTLIALGYRLDQESVGADRLRQLLAKLSEEQETDALSVYQNINNAAEESRLERLQIQDELNKGSRQRRKKELAEFEKLQDEKEEVVRAFVEGATNAIATFDSSISEIGIDGAEAFSIAYLDAAADIVRQFGPVGVVASAIIEAFNSAFAAQEKFEAQIPQLIEDINRQIDGLLLDARKDAIERLYDAEIDSIERTEERRLQSYLDTLSEKEIAALKSSGVIQETELERIEREKQEAIDANDQQALALLKNEEQIEKIRAEAAQERREAERDYNNQVAQWEYEKAVFDQKVQLAQAESKKQQALADLPWWAPKAEKARVSGIYDDLISTISSITIPPAPSFQGGGSFIVPDGFENDSFPLAYSQSNERVTVETPAQAAQNDMSGTTLNIGTVIASPDGYRELDRNLRKYGVVNQKARG